MKTTTFYRKLKLMMLFTVFTGLAYAQQVTVTGTVTDATTGESLPSATVQEMGTGKGVTTDLDGKYTITVSEGATLLFSFVGYTKQEINVSGRTVIDVGLEIPALSEIVVVGYGEQRKEDLTGAVSVADPEEMLKQATNDVSQMMQGRLAGVSVTSDGQPGAAPSIRIRGVSTFGLGSGAEPLYVVDGFPLAGGIRDINPNDIESLQVLKDATAGAIYGNRAANGVVIITTKGGRRNESMSVSLNAYYGIQTIPQRIPVLDREGYQMILNEMLTNAGAPLISGNDPSSPDFIDDISTDWQNAGYQDGSIQNYNVGIQGGTEKTSYYISGDVLNNQGTLVGSGPDYSRYSFRVNSETQQGRIKFGENILVMNSNENPLFFPGDIALPGGRPSLVNDLLIAAPTIPLYDPNRLGGFGGADAILHNSITLNVPGINTLVENATNVNRVLANLYGEVELMEGLKYKMNLQYDNTSVTDQLFVPQYDLGYFFPGPVASLEVAQRNSNSKLIENTLTYTNTFGKHQLNLLVGQSYQTFDFRRTSARGAGLEAPYVLNLQNATSFSVEDNIQFSAISSLMGRVNYSFDDRYLLTVNMRRDGSSKFRPENRYEIFPSMGLAWKIHNDFGLPNWVESLKLRGGIGQLGNQEIGNYRYQGTINRGIPYQFGNDRVFGGATTFLVDPAIKWETRITRNIALDASLFNGGIEVTAEYYNNTSVDVLLDLPIPLSNGSLAGLATNAGSIQNSGFEFAATYRKTFNDFAFDISPNFYTVKNEILDLGPRDNIAGTGTQNVIGRAIGEHYGWVYDGIFQSIEEVNQHATQEPGTAPGDIRFADVDGDGVITDDDRQYLGQGMPTYYYGINLGASYKGFDFTMFGSGSGGNLINSNLYRGLMPTTGFTNWHEDILNRWTPDNTNTEVPRVVWQDPNRNSRDSDRPGWLQDGDYFRINTISLGYSFSDELLRRVRLQSARVYFTMQNVHTFTKYKGYNPDFQSGILNPGFDFGTYPRPRTTMLGVQLKF